MQAVSQECLKRRRGRRATFFLPHNPVVCAHGEKRTRLFGSIRVRTPSVVCAHGENKTRKRRLSKKIALCAHNNGKPSAVGVRTRREKTGRFFCRMPVVCAHAKHQTYTHEHACGSLFRYHRFSTAMKAKINTR